MQSTVEVLANLVGLNSPDGNILPTAISRSVTAPSHMSSLDNHQPVPMSKQLRKLKRYDEGIAVIIITYWQCILYMCVCLCVRIHVCVGV